MRSLRTRLLALWLMLATSAVVTGFVLFESYRQSANSQIIRAEDVVARGCRDIGDRYSFVVAGWNGSTRRRTRANCGFPPTWRLNSSSPSARARIVSR